MQRLHLSGGTTFGRDGRGGHLIKSPQNKKIERVHDGHIGGGMIFLWKGTKFYFYANISYCLAPPTWLP